MSTPKVYPPQILSDEHERDPYATYRILREHYPIHFDESTNLWIISRMEDLRTLFKHPGIDNKNYEVQIGTEAATGHTLTIIYTLVP